MADTPDGFVPVPDDEWTDYTEDMRDNYPWADDPIDHDEQDRRAYQEELIRLRKEGF